MLKKLAYWIVLKDLCNCNMFVGKYDASHYDNDDFMDGIGVVMEAIAYHVNERVGGCFNDLFIQNLIKSKEKALTK